MEGVPATGNTKLSAVPSVPVATNRGEKIISSSDICTEGVVNKKQEPNKLALILGKLLLLKDLIFNIYPRIYLN